MPALRLYGRTWNTASDVTPAIVFATGAAHAAWLAIFGGLWFGLLPRAAPTCAAPGIHYQAFMMASLALFTLMLIVEVATFYAGWRGAPLEVSKRWAVTPLAYTLTALWLAQLGLTLYGLIVTASNFSAEPCWTGAAASRAHGIASGMVATVRRAAIERAAAAAGIDPLPLDADGDGEDDDDGDPDTAVGVDPNPAAAGGGVAIASAAQVAADAAADAADAAAGVFNKRGGAPIKPRPAASTAAAAKLAAANAAAAARGQPPPPPSRDWPEGAPFPVDRRVSVRFPTLLTPSELHAAGADPTSASAAQDQYLGQRDRVPFDTMMDAAHWGRYACAVYGVAALSENHGCSCGLVTRGVCGACVPACAPAPPVTHATIRAAVLETAGIQADDLLFFSTANDALSTLPYMLCLDRARRTIVLAVRGTASLSDAITDIALVPVDASRCVPDDLRAQLDGPALAHSGILQAAEAILTHVDTLGLLDALLDGCHTRLCAHAASLDEAASAELAAQASGPLARVASARVSDPTALEAAAKAVLPDTKGWRLVVTGHSLGAGTAALLALMLKPRVPGVRCWAFSPPGCTVSSALLAYTRSFIVSVAAGKDVVPRASAAALNRLVDEMIVSLGRCRHPKLKVLLGGWWRRKARPPASALFHAYEDIPDEAREFMRKYFLGEDIKDRGIVPMFPPGKIVFLRPLKSRKASKAARDAFTVKSWDAVWATAEEVTAEGIIVGKTMLEHHLIEGTVLEAVAHSIIWHPDNPASPQERQAQRALARRLKKVADLVVETRPEDDKFISMEAGTRI